MSKTFNDIGFTNKKKKIEDGKFIIEKTYTGFNHKLDYSVLSQFDFVPKLISDNKKMVVWKFIDSSYLKNPTDAQLKEVAIILRKIHLSEIKLPKNNLRNRSRKYLEIIHSKNLKVKEIEDNWEKMNSLLGKMSRLNPCHCDFSPYNILVEKKTEKIWVVDWEYATMGDKHFDLAYYIESQGLNKRQEKIFLEAYNSISDYDSYVPEWMNQYKLFVNWLTLLWAYAQDKMPFDLSKIKEKTRHLAKLVS